MEADRLASDRVRCFSSARPLSCWSILGDTRPRGRSDGRTCYSRGRRCDAPFASPRRGENAAAARGAHESTDYCPLPHEAGASAVRRDREIERRICSRAVVHHSRCRCRRQCIARRLHGTPQRCTHPRSTRHHGAAWNASGFRDRRTTPPIAHQQGWWSHGVCSGCSGSAHPDVRSPRPIRVWSRRGRAAAQRTTTRLRRHHGQRAAERASPAFRSCAR